MKILITNYLDWKVIREKNEFGITEWTAYKADPEDQCTGAPVLTECVLDRLVENIEIYEKGVKDGR